MRVSRSSNYVLLTDEYYLYINIKTKSQLLYSPYGHYNSYQKRLYRLCTSLHKEGLGYRKISHFLNKRGFKTPFSRSPFKNSNVESLIRKGKVREDRINNMKSHKDYGYEFETSLVLIV